jgi:Tol biopolymer transport system component
LHDVRLVARRRWVVRAVLIGILVSAAATLPAVPAQATFKGRNGQIAWATVTSGVSSPGTLPGPGGGTPSASLTTLSQRGGDVRDLASCGGIEGCAGWGDVSYSPDGQQLLWDQPDQTGRSEVVLAAADASQPQVVADDPGSNDYQAVFSPNEQQIVYVRGSAAGRTTLVLSDRSGQDATALPGSEGGSVPEFTPNGKHILFLRSGRRGIWSIAAGGGVALPLITHAGITAFDLSPNGRQIAYVTGAGNLYLARRDGDRLRHLASSIPNFVRFSPDGKLVAFTALGTDYSIGDYNESAAVYVVKLSGGRPRQIANAGVYQTGTTGLSWQPLG